MNVLATAEFLPIPTFCSVPFRDHSNDADIHCQSSQVVLCHHSRTNLFRKKHSDSQIAYEKVLLQSAILGAIKI